MKFKVGDKVRTLVTLNRGSDRQVNKGSVGVVTAVFPKSEADWPYIVDFSGGLKGLLYAEHELELVTGTYEVGATVVGVVSKTKYEVVAGPFEDTRGRVYVLRSGGGGLALVPADRLEPVPNDPRVEAVKMTLPAELFDKAGYNRAAMAGQILEAIDAVS